MKKKLLIAIATVVTMSTVATPILAETKQINQDSGKMEVEATGLYPEQGDWAKTDDGFWKYQNADGTFATNEWKHIEGNWYYFDKAGIMKTGWVLTNNKWYYMEETGVMVSSTWVLSSGKWYYMGKSGAMVTNDWVESAGTLSKNSWYYLGKSGAMVTSNWVKSRGKWYYLDKKGEMEHSTWKLSRGDWYFLGSTGAMLTETWVAQSDCPLPYCPRWYVDASGVWISGVVYHGENGAWKKNQTGWWFLKSDGTYPQNEYVCIVDKWYFFDGNGYMVTGQMQNKEEGGYYYFYEDGHMATNTTIDGYYYDEKGCGKKVSK